jgi:HNH endonuclease
MEKECSICKEVKPLNEYYAVNKRNSKGKEYIYYYPYCKKCAIEKAKISQIKNYEKQLKRMRIRNKLPEVKEKRKKYLTSEKWKNTRRKWQRNNKDKLKKYHEYRKMHKMHDISNSERERCKQYFNFQCAYCGITEDEHKEKFGQQLHMDHVDPDGANDLSNNIPACKSCNSSKGAFLLEEWYLKQNFYSEERLNKIYKWLNDDYKYYYDDFRNSI